MHRDTLPGRGEDMITLQPAQGKPDSSREAVRGSGSRIGATLLEHFLCRKQAFCILFLSLCCR